MGQNLTVENDTDLAANGYIADMDGQILKGWEVSLKPKEKFTHNGNEYRGLEAGERYKMLIRVSQKNSEEKEWTQIFFAFEANHLTLKVSKLIDLKELRILEIEYLLDKILPGVCIEDRHFHTKTYPRCFVANELVSYMILHKIAKDAKDAAEKGQVLVQCRVFEHVVDLSHTFENKYLFFRLRETHKLLEGRMKHLEEDPYSSTPRKKVFRFMATHSRKEDARKIEGWLEKRSDKLGLWKKRYFRYLEDKEEGGFLAYFESMASTTVKGKVPVEQIDTVEYYERGRHGRAFAIRLSGDQKTKNRDFILRAPTPEIANAWLESLKPFQTTLTNHDVVERSALVLVFNEKMARSFAKLLTEKEVAKGMWVCRRGEKCETFYLLKEGKLGIYIKSRKENATNSSSREQESFYGSMNPISFFGENVFITDKNRMPMHKTSIRALEKSKILCLSPKDKEAFLKQYSEVKGQLHVLLQSGIDKRISQVSFLADLKPSDLVKLKLGLHYTHLRPGQVLFYEGDPGMEFFIVYAGELKIVHFDAKTGEEIVLKKVNKAECFGEISLMLPGIPRTATVIANTPTLLLSLHRETFHSFLKITNLDISVIMRERIVNTFKKFHIPFFEAIPQKHFHQLALECKVESFGPEEVIFQEGDPGNKFYIISFGEVAVNVDKKRVALLKQGSYFGEIALVVEDTPRTATCITTRQTVLLSMSKDSFRGFFADRPEALADVELKIAQKKCQIRSIIYHPKGIELFTKFLEEQYAEESIEFWHEVRAYRKWAQTLEASDYPPDLKRVQDRAQELVEKYIREGSKRQVNISSVMAKAVIEEVEAGKATASTFAETEGEVITLLSRDKLGNFKQSAEFRKLMQTVGGYEVAASTRAKGGRKRGGSQVQMQVA